MEEGSLAGDVEYNTRRTESFTNDGVEKPIQVMKDMPGNTEDNEQHEMSEDGTSRQMKWEGGPDNEQGRLVLSDGIEKKVICPKTIIK